MSFVISKEICEQCPFSTKEVAGIFINILRCKICHCSITVKASVGGHCPRFNNPLDMISYKTNLNKQVSEPIVRI